MIFYIYAKMLNTKWYISVKFEIVHAINEEKIIEIYILL